MGWSGWGVLAAYSPGQEEGSREPLTIFGCFSSCSWGHTWGDGEHESSEISLPSQSCPPSDLFTVYHLPTDSSFHPPSTPP